MLRFDKVQHYANNSIYRGEILRLAIFGFTFNLEIIYLFILPAIYSRINSSLEMDHQCYMLWREVGNNVDVMKVAAVVWKKLIYGVN